ncbi:MAG: RagB/SusD family nutrient uptake outer membrane protein [Bacteroidales bacterium]|nr:RagB/SusD family nutrient uptake outer membrane protein [Bacteroidales bacterium]
MKKIVFGLICTVILGFLLSCNDFLDEEPKSEMSTDQNFSAPAHATSAVNALYRTGAPSFYANGGVYMPQTASHGGYLSGFFDNEYKGQEVIADYSQKLSITSKNIAGSMDGVWDGAYGAISRANTAIKYIPSTPDLDESAKATLLAEAKFFRAFNYFYLVKFFGNVPLILEPYESLSDLYVARESASVVYAQIIVDLKDAITALPDVAFTDNGHRITKNTAETVLSHVYLVMSGYPVLANNYADAATAARNVIARGRHSLLTHTDHALGSAYNMIRTQDNSAEYIYTYEFESSIATNNGRVQTSLPNVASTWGVLKYSITNNAYRPVKQYMNVYDKTKDLRAQHHQFFQYSYTYEKDGQQVTQVFADDKTPGAWVWYDEDAALNTGQCGKDFTIYRYAELLLIAAEAIAQSEGVTLEAIKYLTDVRVRAYTTTPRVDIEASLSSLSKDDFIQQVWIERMRELVYDFRTWEDIQRTRKYPVTNDANPGVVSFVNVVGATNPWGQTFQEKHLVWPISDNEMQRNPSLVQNPNYE